MRSIQMLLVLALIGLQPATTLAVTPVTPTVRSSVSSSARPSLRAKMHMTRRVAASRLKAQQALRTTGVYQAYTSSVLTNGQKKVLYFHADWCPSCIKADTMLSSWYGPQKGLPVSVYKVNYDSATELKKTYGVTYQHTFVLVDGTGKKLKMLTGASETDLRSLLSVQ